MNLHGLRVFYHVCNHNSFSRAAQAMFISQPAVSKAVKELEHVTGLPLIYRAARGKGIQLTEAGQALYEHARGIFSLEQAAREDLKARAGLQRGTLVVGASTTVASYWLAPVIARFRQAHPAIEIRLSVANSAHIEQALLACEVDLAFVEGMIDHPAITCNFWQHDPLCIVAPANAPGTFTKACLAEQTWLLREAGSGTLSVMTNYLREQNIATPHTIELGSNEAIIQAVACGLGLSIVPRVVAAERLALNKIQYITIPGGELPGPRPLYYLRFHNRPLTPAAQQFLTLAH